MKFLLTGLLLNFFCLALRAQDSTATAKPAAPLPFREYRMFIPERAIEIREIGYGKSVEPLHGKLAPDGRSVLLRNYRHRESVRVVVVLSSGAVREYSVSPCFIDPVIEAL
jgi:hypothetical protein